MKLGYIIGYPASGKTSVMRATLPSPIEQTLDPIPHIVYDKGIQLGKIREGFSGTDALAYNANRKIEDFLAVQTKYQNVVGEGDRLNTERFFNACIKLGYDLDIVYLKVSYLTAQKRAFERKTMQDGVWVKGRQTKVDNMVEKMKKYVTVINAERPVYEIASQIRNIGAFKDIQHG